MRKLRFSYKGLQFDLKYIWLPQENGEEVKNLLVLGRGRHLNLETK